MGWGIVELHTLGYVLLILILEGGGVHTADAENSAFSRVSREPWNFYFILLYYLPPPHTVKWETFARDKISPFSRTSPIHEYKPSWISLLIGCRQYKIQLNRWHRECFSSWTRAILENIKFARCESLSLYNYQYMNSLPPPPPPPPPHTHTYTRWWQSQALTTNLFGHQ